MSLPGFHFACEEVQQANLLHGRHTVRKQENTDEHHRKDGGQRTEKKYHVHQVFPKVFHNLSPIQAQGESLRPVLSVCEFAYARSPQSVMSPT